MEKRGKPCFFPMHYVFKRPYAVTEEKGMYLISIYFDDKTNKYLQKLIERVADATGNYFMTDNHVPPHITVAAMETRDEARAITELEKLAKEQLHKGEIRLVSVGAFLPQVIYAEPVLNEYLHELSKQLNGTIGRLPETKMSNSYNPFGWIPHCTIGKQLSKEQMQAAFEVLQNQFVPHTATVTSIGIAKPNPHRDLALWNLPD